jgi:hypothetical protein
MAFVRYVLKSDYASFTLQLAPFFVFLEICFLGPTLEVTNVRLFPIVTGHPSYTS